MSSDYVKKKLLGQPGSSGFNTWWALKCKSRTSFFHQEVLEHSQKLLILTLTIPGLVLIGGYFSVYFKSE